jgi:putative oxidoreductase
MNRCRLLRTKDATIDTGGSDQSTPALRGMTMNTMPRLADLAGRLLISTMFLVSGLGKLSGFAGTQAYMESAGVPGGLLPLVIALEVFGALAVIVGLHTRWAAAGLAGFSVAAALLFHGGSDPMQQIMLMKNLAVAGGFLFLVAHGAGAWSLDARRERLTSPGGDPMVARS